MSERREIALNTQADVGHMKYWYKDDNTHRKSYRKILFHNCVSGLEA
jgi:hypothetical protein